MKGCGADSSIWEEEGIHFTGEHSCVHYINTCSSLPVFPSCLVGAHAACWEEEALLFVLEPFGKWWEGGGVEENSPAYCSPGGRRIPFPMSLPTYSGGWGREVGGGGGRDLPTLPPVCLSI